MSQLLEVTLPRDKTCASVARRAVERRLRDELDTGTLQDVKLVVTELVDNAYIHGRGEMMLRLGRQDGRLRLEVSDEGENVRIRIRQPGPDGGGNGLRLVDLLSAKWGAVDERAHVWAELSLSRTTS